MEPEIIYVMYCHYSYALNPTYKALMAIEEIGKSEYDRLEKELTNANQ